MWPSLITTFSGIVLIYHLGNLLQFLAFLLRDQMWLRLSMLAGILLQAAYHFWAPGGVEGVPLFWKIFFSLANGLMIVLLFGGRLDYGIPADARGLFDKIKVLAPGQFRKVLKSSLRITETSAPLLVEGRVPQRLYYLLKGEAVLQKGTTRHTLSAGTFLGEIAFLNKGSASATVTLRDGAECISWEHAALRDLMQRDAAIDIAMRGIFNHDLAQKVAHSMPIGTPDARSPEDP